MFIFSHKYWLSQSSWDKCNLLSIKICLYLPQRAFVQITDPSPPIGEVIIAFSRNNVINRSIGGDD